MLKNSRVRNMNVLAGSILCLCLLVMNSSAQTTEFTYQGSLKDGASTANGNYDFEFRLFDALTAGAQHPAVVTRTNVPVANGSFTVTLDFFSPLIGAFPGATGIWRSALKMRAVRVIRFSLRDKRLPVSLIPKRV